MIPATIALFALSLHAVAALDQGSSDCTALSRDVMGRATAQDVTNRFGSLLQQDFQYDGQGHMARRAVSSTTNSRTDDCVYDEAGWLTDHTATTEELIQLRVDFRRASRGGSRLRSRGGRTGDTASGRAPSNNSSRASRKSWRAGERASVA